MWGGVILSKSLFKEFNAISANHKKMMLNLNTVRLKGKTGYVR